MRWSSAPACWTGSSTVHEATWPAGSQRAWLDTWWADALSTSAEQLRSGGVVVTDRLDHVGVLQLCHGDGAVVYGPRAWLDSAGLLDEDEPFALLHDALCAVREGLTSHVTQVLGPAWYGYVSRLSLLDRDDGLVRGLTAADDEAVAALCNKVGPDEWNEAGMSTGADFGHFQDQQLLAAANLGEWRGVPTLGVLTHPDWRGRGLGSTVVRLAARHALQRSDLIQYRARVSNAASIVLPMGLASSTTAQRSSWMSTTIHSRRRDDRCAAPSGDVRRYAGRG